MVFFQEDRFDLRYRCCRVRHGQRLGGTAGKEPDRQSRYPDHHALAGNWYVDRGGWLCAIRQSPASRLCVLQ
jgi:hypothetical protein